MNNPSDPHLVLIYDYVDGFSAVTDRSLCANREDAEALAILYRVNEFNQYVNVEPAEPFTYVTPEDYAGDDSLAVKLARKQAQAFIAADR